MKALLGERGAQKCEMANLGLPVAPGFCITQKCLQSAGGSEGPPLSEGARSDIKLALSELENVSERRFGLLVDPLLLSVQGDLSAPMHGFRGTVANVGLNDDIVEAWTKHASPHFVWDSYRRLISSFSRAVRHLDMQPFDQLLSDVKQRLNALDQLGGGFEDCHIPTHELRNLVAAYKELYQAQTGEPFPQDPQRQLWEAVHAASRSWDQNGDCSSAVTVQSTISSNYDFKSAVGVTFTAGDAADDEEVRGKWLMNAQSEDMSSKRTQQHVTQDASCQWAEEQGIGESRRQDEFPSLEEVMPGIFAKLLRWQDIVQNHFSDVRGLEFAVHQGKFWVIQTLTSEQQFEGLTYGDANPQELVTMPQLDFGPLDLEEQALGLAFSCDTQQDDVQLGAENFFEESAGDERCNVQGLINKASPRCMSAQRAMSAGAATRIWQALRRLGRSTTSVCKPAAVQKESQQSLPDEEVLAPGFVTPSGLALWQTGLSGGAAAVACRAVAQSMQAQSMSGFRGFFSAGGACRAFPFGAVCCTMYTNLCWATPAEDTRNGLSPFWRMGCAATAVASATAVVNAAQGSIFRGPVLAGLVPTLAVEMCVIDLVKNHAVERGHDVTPVVLVASGMVAGTIAQTIMHPLNAVRTEVLAIAPSVPRDATALRVVAKEGASVLFAGLGTSCVRSMPVVAVNSLVRVGMTTHFMNLAANSH